MVVGIAAVVGTAAGVAVVAAGVAVVVVAAAKVAIDIVAAAIDIAEVDTAAAAGTAVVGTAAAVDTAAVAGTVAEAQRLRRQFGRNPDRIARRLVPGFHNYCKVPWLSLLSLLPGVYTVLRLQ